MLSVPKSGRRVRLCYLFGLLLALAMVWPARGGPSGAVWGDESEQANGVDLRPAFDRVELPVRAQGSRGTCSVFVVAGAMEYALAKVEGEKRVPATRLSVEFLNWASNQAKGEPEDGSFFSDLWKGFEQYGVCTEDDMPYRTEFDPELQPSAAALTHAREMRQVGLDLHWIKPWDPHRGLNDNELQAVKDTLRRGWPVCGGLLWPKKARWVDGVLQMAPRGEVRDGHSVLLVGYQDDTAQPGGGIFMVRDTGNRRGGNDLSYEYVRSYMNDAVWVDFRLGAVSQ